MVAPLTSPTFSSAQVQVGALRAISDEMYLSQPYIAVHPNNPDHLAAIVTSTSKFECEFPNCKVALLLYTSTDGGETWAEGSPFSRARQVMYNGLVALGPDGTLYTLGLRDGAIVLNTSNSEAGYVMTLANYEEVTKAGVAARPWLRIDPRSGQLFLTLDAQGGDSSYVTPSLLRSDVEGRPWSPTARVDQRVAIEDFNRGEIGIEIDMDDLAGRVHLIRQ